MYIELCIAQPTRSKATTVGKRKLVVEEIQRQAEAALFARAFSEAKQGSCMRKESVERKRFSWREVWGH